MRYEGLLYRALNPVYARDPLSGAGAEKYGGRFNRIGRPALYTSLHADTALREANQVGTLQPTMLVAYDADIAPLLDGRDPKALTPFGLDRTALADPSWRDKMLKPEAVPTQKLAEDAINEGYAGMLVLSFARGARPDGINLVLWKWDGHLTLVNDDNRLGIAP